MQSVLYAALGNLGNDILAGRDGWLFYKPGVQYLVEPWPPRMDFARVENPLAARAGERPIGDPLSVIVSFRDQLAARGIRLVVMPVPGKASIYPEMLATRAEGLREQVSAHTRRLIQELRSAGVETIDLFETYSAYLRNSADTKTPDSLYLMRDTHWSPAGMHLAAETAARRLIELGCVELGDTAYELRPVTAQREGDIVRMAEVPGIETSLPAESVACEQVTVKATGELYRDAPDADVLVLGDSFMRIYQKDEPTAAGFIAHLAHALGQPVISLVNDGGATTQVRKVVARQPSWLHGRRVVLWEFVERDIRFGEQGWTEIRLQ